MKLTEEEIKELSNTIVESIICCAWDWEVSEAKEIVEEVLKRKFKHQ